MMVCAPHVPAVCMCRVGGDKEPVAEQRKKEKSFRLSGPTATGGWRASEPVGARNVCVCNLTHSCMFFSILYYQ